MLSAMMLLASYAYAQNKVSGLVKDDKGETLVGAVVMVKNADNSAKATATTDASGRYSVEASKGDIIEFHFLGFQVYKKTLEGETKFDVMLQPDASTVLNDVVVIGYGAVKKADLTGSVSNVKMSDIRDVPTSSIDMALQGRVAGLDIMSSTGEPGATTSIRIRGTRSITASNDPLIVVDGVMDAVSDINDINPSDIENISVLKDASSTAIYGARGANGVILITTKGGMDSQIATNFSVTLKAQAGVSWLPKELDIMDATEFAIYRDMYMQYAGISSATMQTPVSQLSVHDPYSKGTGTNWQKEVTRVAPYQNYVLSLTGFSGKSKFYASLGYNDEQGIVKRSGKRNFTGVLNVTNTPFKWLSISANLRYQMRKQDNNVTAIGGTGIYYGAIYISPLIDREMSYNPLYGSGTRVNNPAVMLDNNINNTDRYMLNAAVSARASFLKYFSFNTKFSYFYMDRKWYWYYPGTLPAKQEGEGGEARRQDYAEQSMNFENTLSYSQNFGKGSKHHIDAMLGTTTYLFTSNTMDVKGMGYLVDEVLWNNLGAVADKEAYTISSSLTEKTKTAFFARFNYNWYSRYYITLTGRADGASTFAENKKWGFFPSMALKWTISNEAWMKRIPDIDDLSLRFSAGRSGNDLNVAYRSLARMDVSTGGYLFDGSQPAGYYQSRIASPNLTWEKTDTYNIALDGSFWNSRLAFTLEAYLARTSDLLLTVQTAQHTGYSNKYSNIGQTTTKGIELTINSRNIVKRNFTWSTTFTISHSQSMVDDIGSESYIKSFSAPESGMMMAGYVKGYPLNSFWGYEYAGVWHNDEERQRNKVTHTYAGPSSTADAATYSLGSVKYIDQNHDGALDTSDLVFLGTPDPIVAGGLQNTFSIKGLQIGVFLAYSIGGKVYNWSEYYLGGCRRTNQYRYMLNGWHPILNPDSDLPRPGINDGTAQPSSFMVHDASFLRLKNVSIGYNFSIKSKVLREVNLNLSAENLALLSTYNGYDPDVTTSGVRRLDQANYPKPSRVVFSVSLKY